MENKHRVKVLNIGEATRLEKITARINKEKRYLARELRDIQDARLLFEANQRSRQENRRRLSEPPRPQTEALRCIQNSSENSSGANNSHQRSSSRLSSNSPHSTLRKGTMTLKSEQQARRLSLSSTPDHWTIGSWESCQGSLNGVPSSKPMRRISLPSVTPVTRVISCKCGKFKKEDLLNATGSSEQVSTSLSNLVPSNLTLSSSMENLRKANYTCHYGNQQSRSSRGGELNKNCNLHQETEMTSRGTSPCVLPVEEDENDASSRELRVMSGQVCERGSETSSEDTVLLGYTSGKIKGSDVDSNKLKLPGIAVSRSPSPSRYTDNSSTNEIEVFKERRKTSPSNRTLEYLTKQRYSKRGVGNREEGRGSGEEEVKAYPSVTEIKRKKAVALERLTRSSVELDQAMMSKFKRIGVGGMGHLLLKTAKVVENMKRVEFPGVTNTQDLKGPTLASTIPDLAVKDLSDTSSQRW